MQLRPGRGAAYVAVGYTASTPLVVSRDVAGASVRTRIRRRPAEVFSGVEAGDGALRWGLEAGLVADLVERESLSAEAPFLGTETSERWQMAAGARLRVTWLFAEGVGLSSSVGADFLLDPVRHVAEVEGNAVVLLQQTPIRPRLELGAFVRLW